MEAELERHATGDTGWQPLWPDPTIQSYISGHSTFSMAAATTLADFFGTNNVPFCTNANPNAHDANNNPLSTSGPPYTTTETDANGNPYTVTVLSASTRCFTSFTDAANEAGDSRVLGGIHFPIDNTEGLITGAAVAADVVANDFTPVPEPASLMILITGTIGVLTAKARGRVQE